MGGLELLLMEVEIIKDIEKYFQQNREFIYDLNIKGGVLYDG